MRSQLFKRVGWLIVLWGSGVMALAVVAFFFRHLMSWAGLTG